MVHNSKSVLGTECSDQDIDGLSDSDTLRSEESVVGCRFFSDTEADHVELWQGQKKGRDLVSFTRRAYALHHFAIDKVSDTHKIFFKTFIDLLYNARNSAPEILNPGGCIDYNPVNLFSFLQDRLPS